MDLISALSVLPQVAIATICLTAAVVGLFSYLVLR